MNTIRDTLTVSELRTVCFDHPSAAFGFMIQTDKPVENIAGKMRGIYILDKSFPLQGGAYGLNVIGTSHAFVGLRKKIEEAGITSQAHYLLRDGGGQVPLYDAAKRGATGLPIATRSLNVPR